ncbi:right-handed parallel beta-helix repeat-containing protein [Oleiharenicola sp. Vm1]|uniref:right-handed parallel beta-helix repeat-containing protein n=1 Tax=Oleiharenicola sp. Vm1 TaxID=3398393 RepID=UPI0039F46727
MKLSCVLTPRAALLAALLLTTIPNPLCAQPSGGPYGPQARHYDVPATGRVFFVAPDGRPEADGAALDRPTTLAAAIERVATGDTVVLRGGTYRTGGLVLSQGVTLQPYADERPVLKGTEVAAEWEKVADGRWRTKWTKLFPAAPADWWRRDRHEKLTPLHRFNNDMVFVDGVLLASVGKLDDLAPGTFYIDYENAWIYLGADPAGKMVEITAHDSALVRTMGTAHGKPNDRRGATLRGLTFTQYAYRALEIEGVEPGRKMHPDEFGKEVVGSTFEDVTISFCSRVAGYFHGDGIAFRRCLIADCGTEGIYVVNSGDIRIERCIVTRTNSAEKITGYFASAIKIFNQSYRAVVRDNLILDNPNASGVWWDVGNVDGVFVDNWVERTNDGFFFEISKGAICAGNVFVDCDRGIHVLNSSNVRIYQNTLWNSVVKIERTERSAVGDHFGWHPSAGPDVTERHGHVFLNNLLAADANFRGPLLFVTQSEKVRDRLADAQLAALDGNAYVRRAGTQAQPLLSWGPVPPKNDTVDLADLAALRKLQPAFEASGRALPDYEGPLFASPELKRFELQPDFPLRRVAVPLPAEAEKALGRPAAAAGLPGAYPPR